LRLHRSPASASHDLNQAGGMKENGPANKPHRSCTRETPPIRDEVFEDLEYVRLSRAQTNPSGSVPNSWLVPLFFPTARIRTVTNFLRRNRLLLNRSASIASAYGFFRSTTRCGGTERDGERICVCAAQNKIVSTDVRSTFDRALGWARWSGGCRGKRKRARAQVLHRAKRSALQTPPARITCTWNLE